MLTVTLQEVQDEHRTVCLWNGAGWTRCWPGMDLPPVHGNPLPPKLYKEDKVARRVMSHRAGMSPGGFMVRGDLEDGLLVVVEVRADLFVVARLPESKTCT